jgi:hypothetical protein
MKSLLAGIGFAAVAVLATVLYYEGLRLPFLGQVIDGAIAHRLEGYVKLSEKTAADAKVAEIKKQRDDYAASIADFEKQQAADAAADAIRAKTNQREIADYVAKLDAAKRACYLDDGDDPDRDFILQHR